MKSKNRVVCQYLIIGLLVPLLTTFIIPFVRYENFEKLSYNFSRANVTLENVLIELGFNFLFVGFLIEVIVYSVQNLQKKHILFSLLIGFIVTVLSIIWLLTVALFPIGAQIEMNFALNSVALSIYTILLVYYFYQWTTSKKRNKVKI